jgi:hypothetical protein
MPTAIDGSKYVLVIKDDFSGFVRLTTSASADTAATVAALLDWFAVFGTVYTWVTGCGSHFKNEVMAALRKTLGGHHHFTTPYCPWANATVEVVNRSILRMMRTLLSELKLKFDVWLQLILQVQSALNHLPADRLGGVAPARAMTNLGDSTPLTVYTLPRSNQTSTLDWFEGAKQAELIKFSLSLDDMHDDMAQISDDRRASARKSRAKKARVQLAKFDIGDFVLVANVLSRANKLALQWRGPSRIIRVVSDYLMEVQALAPPHATSLHHASRLKL